RHHLRIVNAAHHDGPVRVAFLEIDDDFLSDARDVDHAPLFSRPWRSHTHPARAIAITLAHAVPVKLHFDAAIFIDENLVSLGSDDHRGLRTEYARKRCLARRTVGRAGGYTGERIAVFKSRVRPAAAVIAGEPGRMLDAGEHVL